ncbi:MAG: thiamine diphosphokinase [Armatimonadetes bacterium]|nr:thiamine diphosphokinase [Armatimonadota bacterium]
MSDAAVTPVVVVGNAPMERDAVTRLLGAAHKPGAVTVGVDGGAKQLLALGILPNVVTGDFDSLSEGDLNYLGASGATIVPTPDQNYTDFDKALSWVRETYPDPVIAVFGATGGRLDHSYSVLSAIIKHGVSGGADICLVDATGETRPVRGGELLIQSDDLPGRVLSLLAFGVVRRLTLTGVRWTLTGETIAPGVRDGTLNEIVGHEVCLHCEPGAPLLVQVHHAPLLRGR